MQLHACCLLPLFLENYSDYLLRPNVFKIQQISDTKSHAIRTEGEVYNSVRVSLVITLASVATSIGTPRITFCQRE
jgi:hypothetical protein